MGEPATMEISYWKREAGWVNSKLKGGSARPEGKGGRDISAEFIERNMTHTLARKLNQRGRQKMKGVAGNYGVWCFHPSPLMVFYYLHFLWFFV